MTHGKLLTGNAAAAWGARLADVDYIPAFPITPQTEMIELLAQWAAAGTIPARFVTRVLKVGGAEPTEGFSNYAMTGKQLPCLGITGDRSVTHVHHGVLDVGMPKPVLHEGDIGPGVQEMHRDRVT